MPTMGVSEIKLVPGSYAQFEITLYQVSDGTTEEAADAPPQLEILDDDTAQTNLFGPTSSALKGGTTAQYFITVNIGLTWGGQIKGIWTWAKGTLTGRDVFTSHVGEATTLEE